MSNIPNTDPTEIMDIDTARQVEQAKISRRAALRKLGFGAGMAAFALLGVDDFAHMVGKRLERMAGDNKTATAVAKEFQQSGIALAGGPSWAGCDGCTSPCVPPSQYYKCDPCTGFCTGAVLANVPCKNFSTSTSQKQCYACCDDQSPITDTPSYLINQYCKGNC